MFELNLPDYDIKLKGTDNNILIWDRLRKKYVALTPEEWVRQHFINFLINEKRYSEGLIVNEVQINLNNCRRRCDSVVYDQTVTPLMIIEYKSPEIKISQAVFDQIIRYNFVLRVKYLTVSNGMEHYCCKIDYEKQTYSYLKDIPLYKDL